MNQSGHWPLVHRGLWLKSPLTSTHRDLFLGQLHINVIAWDIEPLNLGSVTYGTVGSLVSHQILSPSTWVQLHMAQLVHWYHIRYWALQPGFNYIWHIWFIGITSDIEPLNLGSITYGTLGSLVSHEILSPSTWVQLHMAQLVHWYYTRYSAPQPGFNYIWHSWFIGITSDIEPINLGSIPLELLF